MEEDNDLPAAGHAKPVDELVDEYAASPSVHAVRRVARNELFVGASFLAGPLLANGVFGLVPGFTAAYIAVAVVLLAGVAVQTLLSTRAIASE